MLALKDVNKGTQLLNFGFDLLEVLENIFIPLQQLDNRSEIMVIHDDLTILINIPTQLAAQAFQMCIEEWAQISITSVPRKYPFNDKQGKLTPNSGRSTP